VKYLLTCADPSCAINSARYPDPTIAEMVKDAHEHRAGHVVRVTQSNPESDKTFKRNAPGAARKETP
jgi:hypothetical protein